MTTLPSSGTHWIEPAASGAAGAASVVLLTEISADLFEFGAGTGTAAEMVEIEPGLFRAIPSSKFAAFVESPANTFTPTPGTSSATPIVESPANTFTATPGGTTDSQLVQIEPNLYRIIPNSAHRATAFRLGATNNIVFY